MTETMTDRTQSAPEPEQAVPAGGQAAAEQCCEPDCGPDTCGGATSVQELDIEEVPAAAEQCCVPDCGPGTCG